MSHVKNDANAIDGVAKKNKKRKKSEVSDVGGEELADDGSKKKKAKVLSVSSDVEEGDGVDKSSRKEKKKRDKGGIDVNAQEGDSKREGKSKDETGDKKKKKKDKSEKHKDAESSGVCDVGVNQTDAGVTGKIEHAEDHKRKKNKDQRVSGADKEIPKDHVVDAISGAEEGGGKCDKRKVKSASLNVIGEISAGALETEKISHVNLVESQMNDEGAGDIQFVKEKKRKMKKDKPGAGSVDKEPRKKGKENSHGSDIDRDAIGGILKNNEIVENSLLNKKSKKVKFSDTVEVFPHPGSSKKKNKVKDGGKENEKVQDDGKKKKKADDGLIRGKRFSKEEDKIIQNAVFKYIEDHHLGEEGLEMVLHCKSHAEIRDCWREIGLALPQRPYLAVYTRAHVLFERSESRNWTPEEIELVKAFYDKHGADWKTLGIELGKHRFHVKDAWRRSKFPNLKKGPWSSDEYEKLFKLVNMDLSMKALTEKKTKHGMIRDNIAWSAISDELSTRNNAVCCQKWYGQLTSPMIAEGNWANADDYRLLIALNELDAVCEEDVDWDSLFEHRSGDTCRKRWNEMVRHIGDNGVKSFSEKVEILSQRYCPDLLDAREEYDNRPPDD